MIHKKVVLVSQWLIVKTNAKGDDNFTTKTSSMKKAELKKWNVQEARGKIQMLCFSSLLPRATSLKVFSSKKLWFSKYWTVFSLESYHHQETFTNLCYMLF